jgi:hypothetical protein
MAEGLSRSNSFDAQGRPMAEGLRRPNSFGAQADRRPKALPPIEIGLSGRSAPGVGLRRRRRHLPGRRRPTIGRRLSRRLKSAFSGAPRQASASADAKNTFPVGAGRPSAEGLPADGNRPSQALRARRRPPPTQRTLSRSAQADRRPKAFPPMEIGLLRRSAPGVGLRRHRRYLPGRRRPTVGRRPLQVEFIRRSRPTVGRRPSKAEFIRRRYARTNSETVSM